MLFPPRWCHLCTKTMLLHNIPLFIRIFSSLPLQVRQCCTQAQLLAAELRHYCEDCKQRGAYYLAAQECEAVARDLNAQQVRRSLCAYLVCAYLPSCWICFLSGVALAVDKSPVVFFLALFDLFSSYFPHSPTQRELRTNGVSPFSLLSQPSVVERLQAEGSSFVTSNFLFSEPHLQQTSRVASSTASAGGDGMSSAPHSPIRQQVRNFFVVCVTHERS